MQDKSDTFLKRLVVVLVALTGTISLIISEGQVNLWTTIVGITLFLVLYAYGRPNITSRFEGLAFSATCSLCIILAIGWLLSFLGSWSYWPHWIVNGVVIKPFAPNTLIFICWLVASLIISRYSLKKLTITQSA